MPGMELYLRKSYGPMVQLSHGPITFLDIIENSDIVVTWHVMFFVCLLAGNKILMQKVTHLPGNRWLHLIIFN